MKCGIESVCYRKKLQNIVFQGAVAQVQGWKITAGAESAKLLEQTVAGGRRTQPGKIYFFW